ncbi:flavodoxin domain-containing protein [uncultured Bacteroides sp.]|uniref:flavodoxin domain-containing protein n=1 Tax=uncultured Bacteroides sp. TaxID=162156 RepID=UPI002AAA72DD|nr:flavodoxin domain-containing protein [uncultured Bacteroides sp.]
MKTAIIYLSKYGTTKKVAGMIGARLIEDEVTMVDLSENKSPDLSFYDRIIVGSSVYTGTAKKKFKEFLIVNHVSLFAVREIGLFLCGMEPDSVKQQEEMDRSFPEELLRHSKVRGFMGGELILEKMNFIDRLIVKKLMKTTASVYNINEQAIDLFVEKMQS